MALYDTRNVNPSQPWVDGINAIGQTLLQAPAIRARAREYQQMGDLREAQKAEADNRSALLKTQTDKEQFGFSALKQFTQLVTNGLIKSDAEGNLVVSADLAGPAMGAIAAQSKSANDMGSGTANFLKGVNAANQNRLALKSKADSAMAVANANNTAKAALPANNQVALYTGQSLASRLSGQPIAQGGVTLKQGEQRFAPSGGDIAPSNQPQQKVDPIPQQPKSSLVNGILARSIADVIKTGGDAKDQLSKINALTAQLGGLDGTPAAAAQPATNAVTQASSPPATTSSKRQRQPWEPPPKINFDTASTHPEMAKVLQDANDALAKGADWDAVTNRLSQQFGINLK